MSLDMYVDYWRETGQIGLSFLTHPMFAGYGLGTQMLEKAVTDIADHPRASEIWAVTPKHHRDWSRLWNFLFSGIYRCLLRH